MPAVFLVLQFHLRNRHLPYQAAASKNNRLLSLPQDDLVAPKLLDRDAVLFHPAIGVALECNL